MLSPIRQINLVFYIVFFAIFFALGQYPIFETWVIQFWVLTAFVALFNVAKIIELYQLERTYYFINPIFIGCLTTILLSQGALTNWALWYHGKLFHIWGEEPIQNDYRWVCMAMQGGGVGSIGIWLGYEFDWGRKIFTFYNRYLGKLLTVKIDVRKVILIAIFGYLVKMYLFSIGMYGYQALGLKVYIYTRWKTFESLSRVVFVILFLYRFRYPGDKLGRVAFLTCFILELLFALAHGARSQIVFFFITIFILDYYITKKIKLSYIPIGFALLFAAFTVGGAFKRFYTITNTAKLTDPVSAISGFMKVRAKLSAKLKKESDEALYMVMFGRMNYTRETAMALEFKYGSKHHIPDAFKWELVTVPVFALLPRYFFFGIKEFPYGRWMTRNVYKNWKSNSSTAMSPVGNLFMTGGLLMVFIGFFFYGIMLRILYLMLMQNSIGMFFMYIFLLAFINTFDSNVAGTFITFIRYAIVAPVFFFLFLGKVRIV